ncbi:MAG: hypothetical protein N3B12_00165 [Armatimonadetes bacterium]|nr:hypothetical protein [Armatimonadota bacterium]
MYFIVTIPFGCLAEGLIFGGQSQQHVLGALNPGLAAYTAMQVVDVCGVTFPLWLVAVGLHFAVGALLLLVASTHVRYKRAERALPIRIILILVTASLVWLLVGNLSGMGSVPAKSEDTMDLINVVYSTISGFVALLTCAFATGPVRQRSMCIPSVRKMFKSDLAGAVPLLVLWTALSWAAFIGTLAWLMNSQANGLPKAAWKSLFEVGISLVAIASGFSALGVLASCCVKQRKNAVGIVLGVLTIAFAGYLIVFSYYPPGF